MSFGPTCVRKGSRGLAATLLALFPVLFLTPSGYGQEAVMGKLTFYRSNDVPWNYLRLEADGSPRWNLFATYFDDPTKAIEYMDQNIPESLGQKPEVLPEGVRGYVFRWTAEQIAK